MNRADFKNTIFEKLRDPQALRSGKCEIYLFRDAQLKERQMFRRLMLEMMR